MHNEHFYETVCPRTILTQDLLSAQSLLMQKSSLQQRSLLINSLKSEIHLKP